MTNSSNLVYDTLIIGGGPAGIFAAYLAKNKGLYPLLIEANDCLGGQPLMLYSQKIIHDYPGYKEIKAHVLMNNLIEQLNSSSIEVLLKTTITHYTKVGVIFNVQLSNGHEIKTKSIIIATGAGLFNQNKLDVPGGNAINVEYTIHDLKEYKGKDIIILGGGDSAVDWANELATCQYPESVSIIHRRDEFRANGDNVNRLKQNGVNIYLNYLIKEIKDNELFIESNTTHQISKVPFNKIIVQYGQTINPSALKIFPSLNVTAANRIIVNAQQLTNLNQIYAIGNVCIYEGKPSSIICAHGEAAVAVRDILNKVRPYDKKTSY